MDFSQLLKHCRDEHGVEVDPSVLMKELLITIFRHFDRKHGLILHDTEIWLIFETLQNEPKPGNPPPIVADMKRRAFDNLKSGEEMESASWYAQSGVLLSNRDALAIVEFCERANVPEQLPDYGTGFRPPWDLIGPEFVACTIDNNGAIYFWADMPKAFDNVWYRSLSRYVEYPYRVNAPVKNWQECLWIRPGHGEKEGAE